MVANTTIMLHKQLKKGKRVLAEGANGAMLDIDHGTYPFVTSSTTTVGGICSGLGIPPELIGTTIATVKAYTTRVGSGPFPTELDKDLEAKLQTKGAEFGVTTGRTRRCGWLDLNMLRHSTMINGYTSIFLTKLDVLSGFEQLKVLLENDEYKSFDGWSNDITKVRRFNELPINAQNYVKFIEEYLDTPVSWIGVGPGRDEIIQKI